MSDISVDPSTAILGGVFQGRVHVLPVRIYYEDTDFSGVVYHASYVRFLERGRSDCLRLAGVHHADLWERGEPLAFSIHKLDLEFLRPARIDDLLEVRTLYTKATGARIEARQIILRGEEEMVRAHVYAACINNEGRPRRLPQDVIDIMSPYIAPQEG